MAIAPSNNLLSALSQLQANRPAQASAPAASARLAAASPSANGPSFAAQLNGTTVARATAATGQSQAPAQKQSQAESLAQSQIQAPPPQSHAPRGRYLGQNLNIVV